MRKNIIEREMAMELAVGAFMVLLFVGLGVFTIVLSRDTWWSKKYPVEVVFSDVMGLRDGDNVVVRGMPVGKVITLRLEPDGVHVMAALDEPVECREGYKASVVTTSMLGGRHMEIEQGPATGGVLRAGSVLVGEDPRDLMADAAEAVGALKTSLIDGGVIENLQETSRQVREISERLNAGEGTLGKLLSKDDQLYKDLSAGVASFRDLGDRLNAGEGTLGKLLSKDDQLYKDLSAGIASFREIADRLNAGEGTLGKLLSKDDQLYKDLSEAVATLNGLAKQIDEGKGMFGRLMKDDSMYDELMKAIDELRGWIDDSRETSPVVNFSTIFFGAF
jgi:phospholipid/cholesterol/gamma-HCH transport system substrate-binding protein